jgi:hypothetical protein
MNYFTNTSIWKLEMFERWDDIDYYDRRPVVAVSGGGIAEGEVTK